jgi:hypothetical protein
MQAVLIVAFISALASCMFLGYAFVGDSLQIPDGVSRPHAEHIPNIPTEAVNLERTLTVERAGDALVTSRLNIDKEFMDDMNSCHFCTKIEYAPGPEGKAAIAFRGDNLNLTGYQRLVFFARGEQEQEVSFIAIGSRPVSSIRNGANLFPDEQFAVITKNVTLDSDWKRFEINLNQVRLEEIIYPFGFVLSDYGSGLNQIFYLKGITFDRKPAQNPLPLANLAT